MSEEFKAKLRSINFGFEKRRSPKVTTDVHDHHTVDVTEHWDDRVDVNAKMETIKVKPPVVHGG